MNAGGSIGGDVSEAKLREYAENRPENYQEN